MTPGSPDLVFIDSSVLFAASMSARGHARGLLVAGLRGSFHLIISSLVLEETERNLSAKAPRALPVFEILRDILTPWIVDPPDWLIQEVAETIELKDAPIVAAAVHGRATFLATYDRRHLLSEAERIFERYQIRVVRPDAIMAPDDEETSSTD